MEFLGLDHFSRGVLSDLLHASYAPFCVENAEFERVESPKWKQFDETIFNNLTTMGGWVFVTVENGRPVGFASYDPRDRPDSARVSHNCVTPSHQGKGIGTAQIRQVLQRLRTQGVRLAKVSTGGFPFFAPARRMYEACGFREASRTPTEASWGLFDLVEYEMPLPDTDAGDRE